MGAFIGLGMLISWLVASIALIAVGFRSKAHWSSPYCIACKYDLRGRVPEESPNCPECGADLTHPKSVGFIRRGRHPRLIIFGFLVLLLPVVLGVGSMLILPFFTPPNPGNLGSKSNSTVLAYVKNQPDQPWGWDELTNRIQAGSLSAVESEQVLQGLIAYMKNQKPGGWDSPLPWQDDFLKEGYRAGHFSDNLIIDFADAFHGSTAKLSSLRRIKQNDQSYYIEVQYGNHWSLSQHGGMPVDLLWVVEKIEIADKPVAFQDRSSGDFDRHITLDLPPLAPGEHDVRVTLAAAYIDTTKTNKSQLHQVPPDQWPQPIKKWTIELNDKLTVIDEQDKPVPLSTDPTLDPGPSGIAIQSVVVSSVRDKLQIKAVFTIDQDYRGCLSYDTSVVLDGQEYSLRPLFCIRSQNRSRESGTTQDMFIDSLDTEVRTAQIILTPNPEHVYRYPEAKAVWGKPMRIKDVPVFRYDLQDSDADVDGDNG